MSRWKKKRSIMKHYDLTANIYDMQYAEEQKAKIEATLKNIKFYDGGFVLDVGCGTGLLFKYVADKVQTTVGLDISRKTLLQAKKRAKAFTNVHLVLADADHMPFKEAIFSHIFAVTLLQNMPNPNKTLKEIMSVASGNAVIVVTGLKKVFPLEDFKKLLRNSGLKIMNLIDDSSLKCYAAVCTKLS